MDDDGFEAQYDVVLCGTGLVQSILSAALSKSGKKVLHLDKNDFYGGDHHATHTLAQFLALCHKRKESGVGDGSSRNCCGEKEKGEGEGEREEEESLEALCASFEQRGEHFTAHASSIDSTHVHSVVHCSFNGVHLCSPVYLCVSCRHLRPPSAARVLPAVLGGMALRTG